MEKSTFLKNTKIELNREYIDMYDISGQDSVSEHSLIRYKKDKEQDILIDNQVKISPVLFKENHYINIVNPSEEFIKFTKKDEIFSLIESKLKNQDIQVQLEGVKNIRYASDQEKDL